MLVLIDWKKIELVNVDFFLQNRLSHFSLRKHAHVQGVKKVRRHYSKGYKVFNKAIRFHKTLLFQY